MKRHLIWLLGLCCGLACAPPGGPPEKVADLIAGHYLASHDHFSTPKTAWGPYHLDFTLEAMLMLDEVRGETRYLPVVQGVWETRGLRPGDTVSYRSQPFCALNFALFRASDDSAFAGPFLHESERFFQEVGRSPEGAITHKFEQPGRYLLIDYLKEYVSRMTKAAYLSGDPRYAEEAARQVRLYRQLLRDPETGLYHQGRGWLEDPMALSPGAWSRGQGWLMHGLTDALRWLPAESEAAQALQTALSELAAALLERQDAQGMWHQLVHLPPTQSYPESSGTALISYALARAVHEGWLPAEPYAASARQAFAALRAYVGPEGEVHGTCRGPGPLASLDGYRDTPPPDTDPHGPPALLWALAGEILLGNL